MLFRSVSFTGVVPVTNMNAFNLSVFSAGDIDENNFTHSLVENSEGDKIYKRIFIKDNIIIGAIIIGESKDSNIIKKFIDRQTLFKDIDFTNISVGEFVTHLRSIK